MAERSINLWGFDTRDEHGSTETFLDLVSALRGLQDIVTCCDPPDEHAREAAELIERAHALLAADAVVPGRQYSGLRGDVDTRAHPFIVPVDVHMKDAEVATGTVTFSRFYLGGGTAIHGGAVTLLFDDFLGRLSNSGPPTRTAYLRVDFRRVCPVDVALEVRGRVTRREGRKIFISGALLCDGDVVAECEGLWIVLRADATPEETGFLQ
ncbi:PaaI family thioesterase [Streptosporangium sp. NPDC006013]|uniref:PaaI family thioesterase n=1 Tax=Streptosporangium sp. NPDC006013 TaxID=3155596 RepID=UPI0033A1EAD9